MLSNYERVLLGSAKTFEVMLDNATPVIHRFRETPYYLEYTRELPSEDLLFTVYALDIGKDSVLMTISLLRLFDEIKKMLLGFKFAELFAAMLEEWPLTSRVFLNSLQEIPLIGDVFVYEGQDPDDRLPSWFLGRYIGNLPLEISDQAIPPLFGLIDDFVSIGLVIQSEWVGRSPAQVILAAERLQRTWGRNETKEARSLMSDKDRKRMNQIGIRTMMSRAGVRV